MIADNGYKFAYFYDTQGNYSLDFDYEEDFQKIRKEVRDKCVPDTNCGVNFTLLSMLARVMIRTMDVATNYTYRD